MRIQRCLCDPPPWPKSLDSFSYMPGDVLCRLGQFQEQLNYFSLRTAGLPLDGGELHQILGLDTEGQPFTLPAMPE